MRNEIGTNPQPSCATSPSSTEDLLALIEELRAENEALRESEEHYRALAQLPFEGVAVTQGGVVVQVNSQFARIHGYEPHEVIGVDAARFLAPEDRERALEAMRSGEERVAEYRGVRKDGAIVFLEARGRPCLIHGQPGRVTVLRDITARKQAEERTAALQQITAALSAALTPEDVCRVALEQAVRVLGAKSGAVALLDGEAEMVLAAAVGYPAETVAAFRRFPCDTRVPTADAVRSGRPVLLTSPEAIRDAYPRREGPSNGLSSSAIIAFPVKIEGRILGAMCLSFAETRSFDPAECAFIEAITGQVAQALERARLFDAERRAREGLREADRRKDEFLAMLAHELRNPLAAIAGAVELLRAPNLSNPDRQRTQDAAVRQTRHMAHLLDDLLDVSRITQGRILLKREQVALATVVESAVEAVRPLMDGRGHELFVSLPGEPLRVDGDPVRLAQILSNLLSNAAKYTPAAGRIWLSARRRGDEAEIRVRDGGMGIARDLLPHVFDLFVQADHSPGRSQGGLGIGLTMVRSLVQVHGGRVEAHSEGLGRGSEFVVWLPSAPAGVSGILPGRAAGAWRVSETYPGGGRQRRRGGGAGGRPGAGWA